VTPDANQYLCGECGTLLVVADDDEVHGLIVRCRECGRYNEVDNIIAAISGHRSLKEVARYTAAADQELMARAGMAAMSGGTNSQQTSGNPLETLPGSDKKP
jgi:DNA-directed RNA polymerase subunit M/transcription elongation factor TFIIS